MTPSFATPMSRENIARCQAPSLRKAVWQIVNSVVPYLLLWLAMVYALKISYWLMLPLAVLAAGFLVRIFIIFHDCGHSSFFASRRANRFMGTIAAFLNWTPYRHWRGQHALHHGTAGNLDRRGSGDIWTMTVEEYRASSRLRRIAYRMVRHPLVLFVLAPLYVFVVHHRFAASSASTTERASVRNTNLALLVAAGALGWLLGWKAFATIQSTVLAISGASGLWLFYVQHQFDGAYWSRGRHWNYTAAALHGSSYYKLPKILQWFTGNIGYHHIHHLNPRIANYHLESCHNGDSFFRRIPAVTLLSSLNSVTHRLWDERRHRFVGFRRLRTL